MLSDINNIRNTKRNLLTLISLTGLALATRIYGLPDWPLEDDEYFTVFRAAERYTSLVNPAYYALVLGSFKLFGTTEWSARLPAMLLGVLSIPVFYVTWQSIIGRNAAIIGALFILLSSWHLDYSQFSRFYSGVFLFGSLSYFLYYKAIRFGSQGYLAWAILANILGILFHVTSVMVPISCAAFSVLILLSKHAAASGYSKRIAVMHLAICTASGLLAAPFLWQVASGWYSSGQTYGYGPVGLALQIPKYVQVPIAISALVGVILLMQKDVLKGVFFTIGIGVPVLALLIGSLIVYIRPDYMLYALPLIFAVAAYLCDQIGLALINYRLVSHALTIVLIASMLPETVSYYTGKKSLDFREVVAFVENAYQPGDQILSLSGGGFNFYAQRKYKMEPYYGWPNDNNVDWKQVLRQYKDKQQRLWIILPIRRQPLAQNLEYWLLNNARLVWRKHAKRYDYTVMGYQIFLVSRQENNSCN